MLNQGLIFGGNNISMSFNHGKVSGNLNKEVFPNKTKKKIPAPVTVATKA